MTAEDRLRWDTVHADRGPVDVEAARLPAVFAPFEDEFPVRGHALELACGRGGAAVWLARRGLHVWGVDVSPVAVDQARRLAADAQVDDRCRFDVADLDDGLPAGPEVDVIICHRFRAPNLNGPMVRRLRAEGLLAVSWLSEVDAAPGRYRAAAGELTEAFASLTPIAAGEGHGIAWLIARKH